MSHIIYRHKGYKLNNKIKVEQLDYDRFGHIICRAYNLVGDSPEGVLEILSQVKFTAYAEKDWNLFNLIDMTKTVYEKAGWEFREDFNKAVDRLIKRKCEEFEQSVLPLVTAATQSEQVKNTVQVEENQLDGNQKHLAEALKHIRKPVPPNKKNGPVFMAPKGHVLGE